MKNILKYGFALAFGIMAMQACTDKMLDKIDVNPNSPEDVPISNILAQCQTDVAFAISGTDLAWYSSVFVEHTTGVHGQLEDADRRQAINSSVGNNSWVTMYAGSLKDLNTIIRKGSTGNEAGNWKAVGVAKILTAYTLSIATDLFGRVPYSEALQGSIKASPKFDNQEQVYKELHKLLDEAIVDLAKPTVGNITNADFIYKGNAASWTRAAWALKARFYNRLSKRDPAGSATSALDALSKGFTESSQNMIFDGFSSNATGENPWYQESNDRGHHAVSQTFFDVLNGFIDPRRSAFVGLKDTTIESVVRGVYKPAPNGRARTDQSGAIYSKVTPNILFATAPMPLITYDELKFIEAEAQLRLGQTTPATLAYSIAVEAAMLRQGIAPDSIAAYKTNTTVFPVQVTQQLIMSQKYISFWLFQPIEAFNDWRRTGIPTLTNVLGRTPRRFPYPQSEIDANPNTPAVRNFEAGVWWDDGTED